MRTHGGKLWYNSRKSILIFFLTKKRGPPQKKKISLKTKKKKKKKTGEISGMCWIFRMLTQDLIATRIMARPKLLFWPFSGWKKMSYS